jgi:(p)ppGpp synthase/HD superfamily hydrolase
VRHVGRTSCSDLKRLLHAPASRGVASKLYSNGNYIRVRSFILSGAPPSTHPLHDAVEDQEVPVEMIAREFGKQVADIVMEVTDDKTLSKDERKRKQIETAPKKSREAKLIKLADKTSNLRAIASSPAADWSVKRRLEYIEWAKNVVAGLAGCRLGLSSNSTRLSQPPSRRSIHRWRVRSRK